MHLIVIEVWTLTAHCFSDDERGYCWAEKRMEDALGSTIHLAAKSWENNRGSVHSAESVITQLCDWNLWPVCIVSFPEDCFDETLDAMVHLGITTENQRQIFKVKQMSESLSRKNWSHIIWDFVCVFTTSYDINQPPSTFFCILFAYAFLQFNVFFYITDFSWTLAPWKCEFLLFCRWLSTL